MHRGAQVEKLTGQFADRCRIGILSSDQGHPLCLLDRDFLTDIGGIGEKLVQFLLDGGINLVVLHLHTRSLHHPTRHVVVPVAAASLPPACVRRNCC